MRKTFTTSKFDRRLVVFIKLHPTLSERVKEVINKISRTPFDRSLKSHKLSGPLSNCFASSITHDYRIVFTFKDEDLWFLDIGPHDKVY